MTLKFSCNFAQFSILLPYKHNFNNTIAFLTGTLDKPASNDQLAHNKHLFWVIKVFC